MVVREISQIFPARIPILKNLILVKQMGTCSAFGCSNFKHMLTIQAFESKTSNLDLEKQFTMVMQTVL